MESRPVCPMLFACPDPNVPAHCMEERCAWWVPGPKGEDRCAVQMLGLAVPELVKGVRGI